MRRPRIHLRMRTLPDPPFLALFVQRACAYWTGAAILVIALSFIVMMAQTVASAF